MIRRASLIALIVVSFWAGPAAAQTPDPIDYPPSVVPTSLVITTPPPTAPPGVADEDRGVEVAEVRGGLARTGADNIGPLIQAGIVLLGAGAMLVLVARRRRAVRRAAA
jgi:LPXTG-motif cell wall-anchored protein